MFATWASQQPGQRGGGGPTPPSNVLTLGTNLNTGQYFIPSNPFTNLSMGAPWGPLTSTGDPATPANVDSNGDLLMIPAGQTWSKIGRNPNGTAGVVTPMVAYWTGPSTGMSISSGIYAGQSGATTTIISLGGGAYKIRFGVVWANEAEYRSCGWSLRCAEASIGGVYPRNVIVCEEDLFDLYGPTNLPIWHDDYVASIIASGYKTLRFMDLQRANFKWMNDVTTFSTTVDSNTLSHTSAWNTWNPGVKNQSLQLGAQGTYGTSGSGGFENSYAIARTTAPLDPFGTNGNLIAVTLNAASGAGTINVDDVTPGEVHITITPDSGGSNPGSASRIAAQILADANAKRWLAVGSSSWDGSWGLNAGTTVIGAQPKTYLKFGTYNLAPDGIPVSWLVTLCNQTNTRPWFVIPLRASQTYCENFAAYVQANYTGSRPAIFEGGNENWNFGFNIANYLIVAGGKNGGVSGTVEWANRHINRMQWIRSQYPAGIRMLGAQNAAPSVYTSLIAAVSPGVKDNTDAGCVGPYFSHDNDCWTTPSATTSIVVAADQMELNIPSTVDSSVTNKTNMAANGHAFYWYEGQQHNLFGAPDLTTMENFQRAPRMKRSMGIWFSEQQRRAAPVEGVIFIDYARITNVFPTGSFGIKESFIVSDANSPKFLAAKDAMLGVYPAYFIPGQTVSIPTAPSYLGTPIVATVPTPYNSSVPPVYVWKMDGGAAAGTNGSSTYTPVAGDLGKVPSLEVTLSNGIDSWTYTSNNGGVVNAATSWMIVPAGATSFVIPKADFKVYLGAPGGNGAISTNGSLYRNSGGSGAYVEHTFTGQTPGASMNVSLPLLGAGGDAWVSSAATVLAKGGTSATTALNGAGTGGLASASIANGTKRNGTNGSNAPGTFQGGQGGPGAPGPEGLGGTGGAASGTGGLPGGGANNGGNAPNTGAGNGGTNRFGTGAGAGATIGTAATAGTNGGGSGGGFATGTLAYENGQDATYELRFTDNSGGPMNGQSVGPGGGGSGAGRSTTNARGGAGKNGSGGGGGSQPTSNASMGGEAWCVIEWNP